ncbi:MAG TPA: protein-glutamine gamma-glutamyltransferase [Clostridiales bacterium]|nr:protein-glutamine gamma-glutamyltransferase [Clostridiales bacterium]
MIYIGGKQAGKEAVLGKLPDDRIQNITAEIMADSTQTYSFRSMDELKFELSVRSAIVKASKDLNGNNFSFAVFRRSRCNPAFWNREPDGGFRLKSGVKPNEAIKNIYDQSRLYATECSTAIVIVFYKALADVLPGPLFDALFPNTYLMNWQSLDPDLGLRTLHEPEKYMPGNCRYFKNPDVNPLTPEWQGENAIDFGDGLYYGHGMGIRNAEQIIHALNQNRKRNADKSAYLMDSSTRLNFSRLYTAYARYQP